MSATGLLGKTKAHRVNGGPLSMCCLCLDLICFFGLLRFEFRIIVETLDAGNLEYQQTLETLSQDVRDAVADLAIHECVSAVESEHREHIRNRVHAPCGQQQPT